MPINPTVEEISLWEVLPPAVIKILRDGQRLSCRHLLKHHSLFVSFCPFATFNQLQKRFKLDNGITFVFE